MKNKSFTLIEILVVIVVVGVLSSFILIVTNSVTTNANITKSKAFSDSLRSSLLNNISSEWKFDGSGISDGQQINTNYTVDSWGTKNLSIHGSVLAYSGNNCISGSCLQFNASESYIDNTSFTVGGNMTFSVWLKTSTYQASGTDGSVVFAIERDSNPGWPVMLLFCSNKIVWGILDGSGWIICDNQFGTASFPDSSWHNFVVISDISNSKTKLYIDGIFMGLAPVNYNPGSTNRYMTLGDSYWVSRDTQPYRGLMDEAIIYNAVISGSQIQQNYFLGLNNLYKNKGLARTEYNQRLFEF